MPWRRGEVSDERLQFTVLASRKEKSLAALCRSFGISRQTGYTWLGRYGAGGAGEVLLEKSRRPRVSPARLSSEVTAAVVMLRQRWPDWGARKLNRLMVQHYPELSPVSDSSIQRILLGQGLIREQDRHPAALLRFEREAPNELWQMDFKGPKGFAGGKGPLSVMDDHSRYVLALRHLDNGRVEAVQSCLRQTFEHCGLPDGMLMDHGTPWWNANSPWGWTELTVGLMRQGIRIYLSGIRHPQTQGKVERMHGVLHAAIQKRKADADRQSWLDEFREEYNTVRPHEALGMKTPACLWTRSARVWQAEPAEWEYPAPMTVVRLNDKGEIQWQGRRWNISAALRRQLVGIDCIGERALVYYCRTPLRELDPGSATSAILPTDPLGASGFSESGKLTLHHP
jgi:transposase InsO family protein